MTRAELETILIRLEENAAADLHLPGQYDDQRVQEAECRGLGGYRKPVER